MDLAYFRRRADQEWQAASDATSDQAGKVHSQLAKRYEDIVRAYAPDKAA
jgi:hypothetical protein